jgi:cold shock protein
MARGTVKWFNSQKGYGFIQPQGGGGKDVFVHISAVEKAGLPGLDEGQMVEYEEVSNRGKSSAENLKIQRECRWSGSIGRRRGRKAAIASCLQRHQLGPAPPRGFFICEHRKAPTPGLGGGASLTCVSPPPRED